MSICAFTILIRTDYIHYIESSDKVQLISPQKSTGEVHRKRKNDNKPGKSMRKSVKKPTLEEMESKVGSIISKLSQIASLVTPLPSALVYLTSIEKKIITKPYLKQHREEINEQLEKIQSNEHLSEDVKLSAQRIQKSL